jgi:1-acyl-sn-glycerol-3-phosphate acyltransferase
MGTNEIFEDHLPWVKKRHVVIRYGTPIDPASLSKEEQKHLGAHCREVIVDMLKEMV